SMKPEYSVQASICSRSRKTKYNGIITWFKTRGGNTIMVSFLINTIQMKKQLTILCGLVFMMISSCKYNTDIDNPELFASVYMPQAESVKELIFSQADGGDQIVVGASYGGVDAAPEDIQIRFEI